MTIQIARRLAQALEPDTPKTCPKCGHHMAEHFGSRDQFVVVGAVVTRCTVQPLRKAS